MLPAAEDNYGLDACDIMCLDTSPEVLVLSTVNGRLINCIVLEGSFDHFNIDVGYEDNVRISFRIYR